MAAWVRWLRRRAWWRLPTWNGPTVAGPRTHSQRPNRDVRPDAASVLPLLVPLDRC
jgi:hypothetical protein